MRISNNITTINIHRKYSIAGGGLAASAEKLSSGYRINRAGDDAAGLAISEKMRAQIRGLNMASKNSQDAVSLLQTAEGALQVTNSILQRMREIAVQSASGSNDNLVDRVALDVEYRELMKEIDDTAKKTKFNNMGVLDGTFASGAADGSGSSSYSVNGSFAGALPGVSLDLSGATGLTDGAGITIEAMGSGRIFVYIGSIRYTSDMITYDGASYDMDNKYLASKHKTTKLTSGLNGTVELTLNSEQIQGSWGVAGAYLTEQELINLFAETGRVLLEGASVKESGGGAVTGGRPFIVQTGANPSDTLAIYIDKMDAESLGLLTSGHDYDTESGGPPSTRTHVLTQGFASGAIKAVDDAINTVSTQRAKLGALLNRLEHKINNLDLSAENLQAAESRIRDIDMAKEMSGYTKQTILQMASAAMLAQANQLPETVLELL